MEILKDKLFNLLSDLYDSEVSHKASLEIMRLISEHQDADIKKIPNLMDEKAALVIAYPDQVQATVQGGSALKCFADFFHQKLKGAFSGVHFLPFFPSSSDGGFSVIDYKQVGQEYGSWEDFDSFSCDLMFDAVFNHSSPENPWFKKWQQGDEKFHEFYHYFESRPEQGCDFEQQIKKIIRPRNSDILTPFNYKNKTVYVWTTFSDDQVDLNVGNYKVLVALVDVLLFYVERHANYIRIDAVPFLWKQLGTTCMSLPQVHTLVKIFRTVLDMTYPSVKLITESNVPHEENTSYFGESGNDEAQLVYNFSLAPLILHSIWFNNSKYLQSWSQSIVNPSLGNAFFNFTATHDGIGVRPLEGLVPDVEVDKMCDITKELNGLVSYRKFDHGEKPYELNITWASAMQLQSKTQQETFNKFLLSNAICLAFPGVPGMYFHNLLGTFNWNEGYEQTQHRRDINRMKFTIDGLTELLEVEGFHSDVFKGMTQLMQVRSENVVFHPNSWKKDFNQPKGESYVFAREYEAHTGLFLFNIKDHKISISLSGELGEFANKKKWRDLCEDKPYSLGETIELPAYGFLWLGV